MNDKIRISKSFTVADWKELRSQLLFFDEKWDEAFQVFDDRIETRFFSPIETIKVPGKNEGEGFSITLISVVLLEFLAAFELGKIYKTSRYLIAPHEYNSGFELYKSFLSESTVFKSHFNSTSKIQNFYKNIRCGLVHEARTMGNDVIIADSSPKNTNRNSIYFTDDGERRLNRDLLLLKLKEHISNFKLSIQRNDPGVRNKFILKMDDIAGLNHVWYFIYGSNLWDDQLVSRLKDIDERYLQKQRCSLAGYQFRYNKKSIDGSSKGNLIQAGNKVVHGIAVLILGSKLDEFIENCEQGYDKVEVLISTEGESFTFKAFTCISDKITTVPPTMDYSSKVVKGAREHGLPIEYIENNLVYRD